MVFGIKRKKDRTSDTWREDGGDSTERKAFKEDSVAQDKIFGTWKEDKNQSDGSDTWKEEKQDSDNWTGKD